MPGVNRPYTLVDVLGTINDQLGAVSNAQGASAPGLGLVVEADETTTMADSATGTAAVPTTWDTGVWGQGQWA